MGHNEVQERPKFLETVLKRCSCYEKAVVCVEFHQRLVEKRVVVLEAMGLVHDQSSPALTPQERLVL